MVATFKKINMPSLYHHEKLSETYVEAPDEVLATYAIELQEIGRNTEIPRQKAVVDRLLGLIAFEAAQRISEQASVGNALQIDGTVTA